MEKVTTALKIIICDDVLADRTSLQSIIETYLNEINATVDICAYENGEAFTRELSYIKTDEPSIVFLDIYMPGIDGIEVARKIRETNKNMIIVFTTTSPDHGLDGYSVKALQYLLKPITYPQLKDTLDDCMSVFADALRYIEVVTNKITTKIPLKDVLYIEILAHDCLIHTMTGITKCRFTLDEMEQQLIGSTFLRTHRSFIVNMRFIKSVAENDFILIDYTAVPIRKNGKLLVKQAYTDYVFAQARGI